MKLFYKHVNVVTLAAPVRFPVFCRPVELSLIAFCCEQVSGSMGPKKEKKGKKTKEKKGACWMFSCVCY